MEVGREGGREGGRERGREGWREVLVSVRAWLLGRDVVNLPTQCSKCVV